MELISATLLCILISYLAISIIVLVNIQKFNLRYFKYGYVVHKNSFKINICRWFNKDGIYQKEIGNYVFIPDMKIGYFVSRFKLLKYKNLVYSSFGPSLTIFGTFYENKDQIDIYFKVFYGALILPVLPIILILVLVTVGIFQNEVFLIIFGVGMIAVVLIIIYIFFYFQKIKMKIMADELEYLLSH